MQFSRRTFVISGLGLAMAGVSPLLVRYFLFEKNGSIASCFKKESRKGEATKYYFACYNIKIGKLDIFDIPFEGHSCIQHPEEKDHYVVFAQRPGTRSCRIRLMAGTSKAEVKIFDSSNDRHFYGHGRFTSDGKIILATENNFNDGTGKIVLRDANNHAILGDFQSHGVGPHDMLFLNDETIVVANGGIKTHPLYENGRTPMNIGSMKPNLSFINFKTGVADEILTPPHQLLSLRHLAANAGTLACVMQYNGEEGGKSYLKSENENIILFHSAKSGPIYAKIDKKLFGQMKGHTLSVAINRKGVAAVTSPFGDLVTFWDSLSGALLDKMSIKGASGVSTTVDDENFLVSSWDDDLGVSLVKNGAFGFHSITLMNSSLPDGAWGSHLMNLRG